MKQWWRTAAIVVGLIALPVVIYLAAYRGYKWADSGRTELAQWLPAVASVATLMAAVVAALFAAAAFGLESRRAEEWRQDRRAEQAALVAIWGRLDMKWALQDGRAIPVVCTVTVSLRNASELPVSRVLITGTARAAEDRGGLFPEELDEPPFDVLTEVVQVLPPSAEPLEVSFHDTGLLERYRQEAFAGSKRTYGLALALEFTDAAGRRWSRPSTGDGSLREVSDTSSS